MIAGDRNYFNETIIWQSTNDPEYPYETTHETHALTIRLNDFPEEHLYMLIVDSEPIIAFDDWPGVWIRDDREELNDAEESIIERHELRN